MLFLVDGKPFQARGERPWSDPVMVVLPLGATTQQVAVKLELDLPAGHTATLVLPCIAPSQVHHGRHVAEFVAAVASCFPDAALPPSALTAREPSRDAVEHELDLPVPPTSNVVHDDQAHHHHAPSDVYVGALRVVGAHELEGAHVPPAVADELRRVYEGAAWGFVVAAVPAGRTTLALAVTCAAPRAGFLYAPTRTGLRFTAEVATRIDGSCGCPDFVPWNMHLITGGTARRGDWAGGGKDPASALDDMRHRFASGTYKVIVPPKCDWEEVRCSAVSLPEVRALFAPVADAPPGASAGTACAASTGGGEHHHHHHHPDAALEGGLTASHGGRSHSHPGGGHLPGGGGMEVLPMHGRTALPTEHNLGGHGFLAAEATAGGHAPHHHGHHGHHHHHASHSHTPHTTGGCATAELPAGAATPAKSSSSMGGGSPPMMAPFRRGVSFKGADADPPAAATTTTTAAAAAVAAAAATGGGQGTTAAAPGTPATATTTSTPMSGSGGGRAKPLGEQPIGLSGEKEEEEGGAGAQKEAPTGQLSPGGDVCMGGGASGHRIAAVSGGGVVCGAGGAGEQLPPQDHRRIPGVGCLDVLRQKKVALGPDVDLLLMLDYGRGETVLDE